MIPYLEVKSRQQGSERLRRSLTLHATDCETESETEKGIENKKTIPETKAENETENYLNTMKYRLKTKLRTRVTRLEKVGKKTRLRRKTCDLFRRPLPFLSA